MTVPTRDLAGAGGRAGRAGTDEPDLPGAVSVRRASAPDLPAVAATYTAVSAAGSGLLTRQGPLFDLTELLDDAEVTVAEEDGAVTGYLSWVRGQGYGAGARLTVLDLMARTPGAAHALLAQAGSWASVLPETTLRLSGVDPYALLLRDWPPSRREAIPWMLRAVDASAAVAARGFPPGVDVVADLDLVDPAAPWHAGPRRLVVRDGAGRLEPGGRGSLRLHARAFGPLFSGYAGSAALHRAGLLDGDPATGRALDAAFAGPPPYLLDYF